MQDESTVIVKRVTWTSLATNFMLLGIKLFAGLIANSTAMIADAVHSASDTAATFAVMIGLKVARRPADENHPYGHAKAESVAAKVVAIVLTVTGFGLAWESFHLLREGRGNAPGAAVIWVAVGAIIVKEVLYRYVSGIAAKLKSSALAADAANHRSDSLSTLAALLGILGARLGFPFLDPLAGIAVGGLILKMAWSIYSQSVMELMDTAPEPEVTQKIRAAAEQTPGVITINDTKARLHGPGILVDMRLCVDGGISVTEGHAIAQNVVENIHRAEEEVQNVLVHVNPCETAMQGSCETCEQGINPEEMLLG
ncbi:MAG TPA: cation diffusion facilitator family transporter [Verrucomicrobiae bacterium]|nr:cation diffusion facilitator family transporter [Verrucomicrobiae bacterium]